MRTTIYLQTPNPPFPQTVILYAPFHDLKTFDVKETMYILSSFQSEKNLKYVEPTLSVILKHFFSSLIQKLYFPHLTSAWHAHLLISNNVHIIEQQTTKISSPRSQRIIALFF